MLNLTIRLAYASDIPAILHIYNQGIEDRIATLETDLKDLGYMMNWYDNHQGRYRILLACHNGKTIGWASLNPYSQRCAYQGVADLSIYIDREYRGKGVGTQLITAIEKCALEQSFHKIVLFTFQDNQLGQKLYQKSGYRTVGIMEKQGIIDGDYKDVMIMEKMLS